MLLLLLLQSVLLSPLLLLFLLLFLVKLVVMIGVFCSFLVGVSTTTDCRSLLRRILYIYRDCLEMKKEVQKRKKV